MARIHLVRHGKAAAGFAAHRDPGLDATGRAQASAVARLLAKELAADAPLQIRSSPLARAIQTAQPLAELWQQDVMIEPRVAEIPSPSDDLEARAAWLGAAMQGRWEDLDASLLRWRADIATCLKEAERDCVMFSHYVAINAAVGIVTDDSRMRIFAPDNCSVTTIVNDGGILSIARLGISADTVIN